MWTCVLPMGMYTNVYTILVCIPKEQCYFIQVSISTKDNDYMDTHASLSCANVRKVPGMPIYGLTQPCKKVSDNY